MKKFSLLILMAIIMSISGWSQETVTVGTGTTTQYYIPSWNYYKYSVSQTLYLASDITATDVDANGFITSLAYQTTVGGTRNFKIYLGTTTLSSINTTSYVSDENMTLVFEGSVNFTANAWTTIEFDEPFMYDGESNLVVGVYDMTGDYSSTYIYYNSTSASGRGIYSYRDASPYSAFSDASYTSTTYPNIQLTIAPADMEFCSTVTGITGSDITSTSATVSWAERDDSPTFYYQIKTASEDWDDLEMLSTTNNSVEFTDLSPNTIYEVRIQANCGTTESVWRTYTFKTACATVAEEDLPYTQNFEGYPTSGYPAPDCWNVVMRYSNIYPYVYNSTYTAHNGSMCLYFYPYSSGTNIITLPEFETPVNQLRASFWLKPGGTSASYGRMEIGVMTDLADTSSFTLVETITASQLNSSSWASYDIDFNSIDYQEGLNYYITFRCFVNNGYAWYLDDVSVNFIPACPNVSALAANNITSTTADLSWGVPEGIDEFTLSYKKTSETEYTVIENVSLTDGVYILEDLQANTNYEWKVSYVCPDDDMVMESNVSTFKTPCDIVLEGELPYVEDFEGYPTSGYPAPDCWNVVMRYNNMYPYVYNSTYTSHNSSMCLYFYPYSSGTNIITLPEFETPVNQLRASFWLKPAGTSASYGRMEIGVMTDLSDTSSFTLVETITASQLNNSNWASYEIDFNSIDYQEGLNYYITFRCFVNNGYAWYLDDVTIDFIPACPSVSALAVNNITSTTADLSWGIPEGIDEFTVSYKSLTETEWTEVENVYLTDGIYTLEGLNSGTTYEWKVSYICPENNEVMETAGLQFSTIMEPVDMPYETDFSEDADRNWLFRNHTSVNYWTIGEVSENNSALFITTDGTTSQYSHNATRVSAEKTFNAGEETEIHIEFDVNAGGESYYDYLKVFLTPATWEFPASTSENTYSGSSYSGSASNNIYVMDFTDYLSQTGYAYTPYKINLTQGNALHVAADITNPNPNGAVKLTFVWRNDSGGGTTTPAVEITNLSVAPLTCSIPTVSVTDITVNSATVVFPEDDTYTIQYKTAASAEWTEVEESGENYELTGLMPSSQYLLRIGTHCSDGSISWSAQTSFYTLCGTIVVDDENAYAEFFNSENVLTCWTLNSTPSGNNWTISSSGYLYHQWSNGTTADAISPIFDIENVSTPYVKFSFRLQSYQDNVHNTLTLLYRSAAEDEWTTLKTYDEEVSAWTRDSIALPNPSATYQINFRWSGPDEDANGANVDSLFIYNEDNAPECVSPVSLAVSGVTENGAVLSWTQPDDVDSWNVYIKKSTDASYDEPIEVSGDPTYEFTDLEAASTYNVYVTAVCENNPASTVLTFSTLCGAITVTDESSYIEYFNTTSALDCWTLNSTPSGNNWTVSETYYALYHTYNSGTTADAITPVFNIEDVTTPYVKYSYRILTYNNGIHNKLEVLYRNDLSETWTVLKTYDEVVSTWTRDSLPLPNPSATYQINFRWSEPASNADGIYIDSLTVYNEDNAPECIAPMGLTVSDISEAEATLSWSQPDDVDSWNVYIKEASATDYNAPIAVSGTPVYELTGLNSATAYSVYVTAVCETEESSSVLNFRTTCGTVLSFPYTEDFESAELGCWTAETVSGSTDWTVENTYTGGNYYAWSSYASGTRRLISPVFDLTQISNPYLKYLYELGQDPDSYDGGIDTLGVYYRTSADEEWTYLTSYNTPTFNGNTDISLYSDIYLTMTHKDSIALPNPSATYQIMFLGYGNDGYGVFVDDVKVYDNTTETPEPIEPTVVTNAVTGITQTSAVLNGAITSLGNQTITARGFEWKLTSATDYTVLAATGNTMTATLTGLTANTSYTYRAFATTANGPQYGEDVTFTTLEQGEEPCTPVVMTVTETVCFGETYTFNGQTYNATGTYTTTVAGQNGDCDTNYTINLTVLSQNTASETITVCYGESATYNGQTLAEGTNTITVSGQGTDCDTLYTVTLVVLQPTSSTTDVTVCYGETYEFNGQTYNATGTYTATLTNAAGCDSVATLNLTVRPANTPILEEVTLNTNELPYTWRGEQYTEFGTYTVTGEDENGCPQEYTLTLVHNSGIAEVENEYSISLYPNPTSENATLSVKGLNEEATVIVTDQAGRVISTTTLALGQETMEVETSKLASGVYYIRIQTANSVRTEKLIRK